MVRKQKLRKKKVPTKQLKEDVREESNADKKYNYFPKFQQTLAKKRSSKITKKKFIATFKN